MTTAKTQKTPRKKRTNYQVRKLKANSERVNSDPGALLNKYDVASRLGVDVQTVLKWARLGDLEAIRLGHRTVRFTQAAVSTFLQKRLMHVSLQNENK
jgi:excisionase family DNA binding protein